MPQMIFVNLPVTELDRSKRFYEALGFTINPQFSDETTACVVISDTIYLMIMLRDRFKGFAPLPVAETRETTAVLIALTQESRAAVDRITEAALSAGGHEPKSATDMGFMYSRMFLDPDGNVFEPVWMDPAAVTGGAT